MVKQKKQTNRFATTSLVANNGKTLKEKVKEQIRVNEWEHHPGAA